MRTAIEIMNDKTLSVEVKMEEVQNSMDEQTDPDEISMLSQLLEGLFLELNADDEDLLNEEDN